MDPRCGFPPRRWGWVPFVRQLFAQNPCWSFRGHVHRYSVGLEGSTRGRRCEDGDTPQGLRGSVRSGGTGDRHYGFTSRPSVAPTGQPVTGPFRTTVSSSPASTDGTPRTGGITGVGSGPPGRSGPPVPGACTPSRTASGPRGCPPTCHTTTGPPTDTRTGGPRRRVRPGRRHRPPTTGSTTGPCAVFPTLSVTLSLG